MRNYLIALIVLFWHFSSAQSALNIREIKILSDSVVRGSTDSLKNVSNERLLILLDSLLKNPETFNASFDSAKSISVITSPDKTFRFYQWVMPVYETNTYKYFGFLQTYNSKTKTVTIFKLTNVAMEKTDAVLKQLNAISATDKIQKS